jgi:hypothetical protein
MSYQEVVEDSPTKDMGSGLLEQPELVEKEMKSKSPIENDHQTVQIVQKYMEANPEFAKMYDYTVEWENTQDESNHNFIAKFKLKQGQNEEKEPSAPAEASAPRGSSALRSTSGQWRSQHAQQREREISGNHRYYRETYTRDTYGGKENYHPSYSYDKRGTSLRGSQSPKRQVQYVPIMKSTLGFGLYEQHREQRE